LLFGRAHEGRRCLRSGLNDGKGSGFNGSPNSERDGRLAGRRSRYKGDGLDDLDGSRGDGLAYRHKGDSLGLDGGRGDGLAVLMCYELIHFN